MMLIMLGWYIFIFLIVIFILLIPFLIPAIRGGDIYYPTGMNHIKTMEKLIGKVRNKRIYDLGSGDGRIVLYFAQKGARAVGVEINILLIWYSRLMAFFKHLSNATFQLGSFWDISVKNADIVVLFIIPPMIPKMEKKLLSELKPGSLIVSYSFKFPHLELMKQENSVFLYRI